MKNLKKSFLYLALLLGYSNVYADVNIEQNPLGGQQDMKAQGENTVQFDPEDYKYAPNLFLALSVEFPTVGAAYSSDESLDTPEELTQKYMGYFDHTLCYVFDTTEKAFIPSTEAKEQKAEPGNPKSKKYYSCNNGGYEASGQEFSGNVMNFLTMSAIDELRYIMTGGNRAKGVFVVRQTKDSAGVDISNQYIEAEKGYRDGGGVYLRRARINYYSVDDKGDWWHPLNGQYGFGKHYEGMGRTIDFQKEDMRKLMPHLVPHRYIPDLVDAQGQYSYNPDYEFNNWYIYQSKIEDGAVGNVIKYPEKPNGTDANRKAENLKLGFNNRDFEVLVGRKVRNRDRLITPDNFAPYATNDYTDAYAEANNKFNFGYLPVVVNACNSKFKNSRGRDGDARKCSENGKTLGIVQQEEYKDINMAAFGYLLISAENDKNGHSRDGGRVHGGVLKAALSTLSSEIGDDGAFVQDPKGAGSGVIKTDVGAKVYNSGVINYLNKFGDMSAYRGSDRVAELYYDVSRYIRGMKDYTANRYRTDITGKVRFKDDFPVISYQGSFEDDPLIANSGMSKDTYDVMREAVLNEGKPMPSSSKAKADEEGNYDPVATYNSLSMDEKKAYRQASCRINSILLIGDTFTAQTVDVPTSQDARENVQNTGTNGVNAVNGGMMARAYTNAAIEHDFEKQNFSDNKDAWGAAASTDQKSLAGNSHPYGIGVAYWMRANDNRKDLLGEQRATNYVIDVLEKHTHENVGGRVGRNQFFAMAKWGGFQLDLTAGGQPKVYDEDEDESDKWNTAKDEKGLPKYAKPYDDKGKKGRIFENRGISENIRGGYVVDNTGAFFSDVNIDNYTICKDKDGNSIPNETKNGYVINEKGTCPFISQDKKNEYNSILDQSKDAVKNNIAKTVNLFATKKGDYGKTGGLSPAAAEVNHDNFPYNLAAGSDPEALEFSLNAIFKSAVDNSSAIGGGSLISGESYSQAPITTSNSLGITICKDGTDACVNNDDPDNPITNEVVAATYDLKRMKGDVIKNQVFLDGGASTVTKSSSDSLATKIKNLSIGREIWTPNPNNITSKPIKSTIALGTISSDILSTATVEYIKNNLGTIVNSNILDIGGKYFGVASNDGVYHIMDRSLEEKYAYIPSTAWEKLKCNKDSEGGCHPYEQRFSHIYINDGQSLYMEDVELVVGTTGRGGNAVYAFKVDGNSPRFAWEFTDDRLGLTINTVQRAYLPDDEGNTRPVIVVSSGYNVENQKSGYIFILDTDGNLININGKDAIEINTTSSLGSPFVYDYDGDEILDAIFVGDFKGNLWAVGHAFVRNVTGTGDSAVVSIDEQWSEVSNLTAGIEEKLGPITNAPYAANNGGDTYIIFATGHSLNKNYDETSGLGGLHPEVQNYGYGLKISDFKTADIETDAITRISRIKNMIKLERDNTEIRDTFSMPQFEAVDTAIGNLGMTGMKYYDNGTRKSEEGEEYNGNWRLTFAKGYTPSLSQIVQRRLAVFMVTKPNTDCPEILGNVNGEISSANDLCNIPDAGSQACLGGTTALIAVDTKSGNQYTGKSVFDTTGDNEIHSESECEGYTGNCPFASMIDPPASIIFIDDFLSTGGSLIPNLYTQVASDVTTNADGTTSTTYSTKVYNAALLSGLAGKKYGSYNIVYDENGKPKTVSASSLGLGNKPGLTPDTQLTEVTDALTGETYYLKPGGGVIKPNGEDAKLPEPPGRGNFPIAINRFGISSFIRNSLREIRR